MFQIRNGFNADPDPAFNLNADPDPGSQTNADPRGSGTGSDFAVTKSWILHLKNHVSVGPNIRKVNSQIVFNKTPLPT